METDWQTMVAILIVVLAAGGLMWQFFVNKSASGCGSGCQQCSEPSDEHHPGLNRKQLFQLDISQEPQRVSKE
jgi:hypothetical protein